MPEISSNQYDVLVAGSGFAGSLTALVLHKLGFKVCLLEKGRHPRFAVGESSTPVADMILRNLALKYDLPWLHSFSRYGSWQQSNPEIVCGIKRGFSFFKHYPGKEFFTDENHKNELLVTASADDVQSDTNWLRADMDAFLVNRAKDSGIDYYDLTEIIQVKRNSQWIFQAFRFNKSVIFHASFFIDATGNSGLLDKLLGIESTSESFLTDTFAVFSHFNNVPRWMEILQKAGIPTDDFPYNPDNSALHHILDEGWLWMLRFNDQRTSLGFVLDCRNQSYQKMQTEKIWNDLPGRYPTINKLIKDNSLASEPGKIIRSGRLQRRVRHCFGPGWAALPHTAGFVDPLFSSGIAQSLAGIEKIINTLNQYWGNPELTEKALKQYELAVFEELKLIDYLVAGCYKTMGHFELFNAWSMLYFASAIAHERYRMLHKSPGYFLNAHDGYLRDIVQKSYADLLKILHHNPPSPENITWFTSLIRERIKPVNTAGLMDPSSRNMYLHTAAAL